jgi:hypothetical protein
MKFEAFIQAVDGLVRDWKHDKLPSGIIPSDQLKVIYNSVREGAVFELAEMQRQRDEAMAQLHRRILLEGELVKR